MDEATARPWSQGRGDVFSTWIDAAGLVIVQTNEPADAALIVEVVNAYDRLRAIEAAARALSDAVEARRVDRPDTGPFADGWDSWLLSVAETVLQHDLTLLAALHSEVPSDAR